MRTGPTYSLNSLLLLTALVAILLGLIYQGRQLSIQSASISGFRNHLQYNYHRYPLGTGCFSSNWELLSNTSDLKIYLFKTHSGDQHQLRYTINGEHFFVESTYDPDEMAHVTQAAVSINWIDSERIKISLAEPHRVGFSDFATARSKHIFHTVDGNFDYNSVCYPKYETMGSGTGGVCDSEPFELFSWNGDESAAIHVLFEADPTLE